MDVDQEAEDELEGKAVATANDEMIAQLLADDENMAFFSTTTTTATTATTSTTATTATTAATTTTAAITTPPASTFEQAAAAELDRATARGAIAACLAGIDEAQSSPAASASTAFTATSATASSAANNQPQASAPPPASSAASSAAAVATAAFATAASAEFDRITAASEAYDTALEARIQKEAERRAAAMMSTLVQQTTRGCISDGLLGYRSLLDAALLERTSEIEQHFHAELTRVNADHAMEQLELVLDGIISRVELSAKAAEFEVTKTILEDEVLSCECQVEAAKELMPIKNFLEVGAKISESKATAARLRKQLGQEQKAHAEQLREEQKTHAESLELMREQLKTANQRLQRLAIGERSLARADEILKAMRKGGPARCELVNQLKAKEMSSVEGRAKAAGLSIQQFNRLVRHLETILFGSGVGEVFRTKLLLAALLERPTVRSLLGSDAPRTKRMVETASAMLLSARAVLKDLGTKGSFTSADRLHFEAIVTALTPPEADAKQTLRTIRELLGIDQRQQNRARKRKAALAKVPPESRAGAFASSIAQSVKRAQYSNFNEEGRKLCRTYWHQHTRFDTNARKKRRHRIGINRYVEHWRHIQYDTNQEMWDAFMRSAEYGAYLLLGGKPISRSLFFDMKCWCIVNADHEECACPLCTQMFELVKDWHRQRSSWYRDAPIGAVPQILRLQASALVGVVHRIVHTAVHQNQFKH